MTTLVALMISLLAGQCPDCGVCPAQNPPNATAGPIARTGVPGPLDGWMGGGANGMDVVFVGDGYTSEEQDLFDEDVDQFIDVILGIEPYATYRCAFNFYRVNVVSDQSGIDYPLRGSFKNNELNSRYGDLGARCEAHPCQCPPNPERYITSTTFGRVVDAAKLATQNFDIIVVVVNDTTPGGGARSNGTNSIVFAATAPGYENMIRHEFSHSTPLGYLADEYDYWTDDNTESATFPSAAADPPRPNLTKFTDPALIKWGSMIDPSTPLPTDITSFPSGTPMSALVTIVGAWEGAGYYEQGLYRPQLTCLMRTLDESSLCKVCRETVASVLKSIRVLCPPGNVLDRYDLTELDKVMWLEDMCTEYPVPDCQVCTFDTVPDTVEVTVETNDPNASATIQDHLGRAVASASPDGTGTLRLAFSPAANEDYRLVVCSGTPREKTLEIKISVWINRLPVPLP